MQFPHPAVSKESAAVNGPQQALLGTWRPHEHAVHLEPCRERFSETVCVQRGVYFCIQVKVHTAVSVIHSAVR